MRNLPEIRTEAIENLLSVAARELFSVTVLESAPSTNTLLKKMAAEGAETGTVLIARLQTAGRGRLGRSFHSPAGCGLYMSVLLRPTLSAERALRITTTAAVAAAEAIEAVKPDADAKIKWVNDIYIKERKVAGILTEAAVAADGMLSHAVLGIGINLMEPEGGFPTEIAGTAGAVFDGFDGTPADGNRLAAEYLNRLAGMLENPCSPVLAARYRSRSLLDGRRVLVRKQSSLGGEEIPAAALGVDETLGLRVRYDDGREETLTSGEIAAYSVHLQYNR